MKIIQSCWSRNNIDFLQSNSGWIAAEYNLMSWALSCLQLKCFYPNLTLYADSSSARILIDALKLPYDNLICELDCLNSYSPKLWALGKIYAYSQQRQPFLHIDNDVFVWERFDNQLLEAGLVAQNLEVSTEYYERAMKHFESYLSYFPTEILKQRQSSPLIHAYNAGIFGGSDFEFFQDYSKKAFEFVHRNASCLSKIDCGTFNIFFEQYLFYCLARKEKKQVKVLIEEVIKDNEYVGFDEFIEVPHKRKYIHLLGTYKRHRTVCDQMAGQLRNDYPEYYYRIIALFKSNCIPLQKAYYNLSSENNESDLVRKFKLLKNSSIKDTPTSFLSNIESSGLLKSPFKKRAKQFITSVKYDRLVFQNDSTIERIKDLIVFERTLAHVVQKKFSMYSSEYLYHRDIQNIANKKIIFQISGEETENYLILEKSVAVIKSRYDWTPIYPDGLSLSAINDISDNESPITSTAVVPEVDNYGYSLINIDALDLLLMNLLASPRKLSQLFDGLRVAFDASELLESEEDYKKLITGRIKKALNSKIVKVLME